MMHTLPPSTNMAQLPKVKRIAEQKKEVEEELARAQKIMVGSVEEDYNTARQHLELLQEALDRRRLSRTNSPKNSFNTTSLSMTRNRISGSDSLLQKLKEAGIMRACVRAISAS